jgi:uncharacterized protein YneF (UPF0154 family)
MNEYNNEPKDSIWLYILLIVIVLLPGFIAGYESKVNAVKYEYQE